MLAWARVGGGASLRKRPSWEPRLWASGFVTISGELGHPQCCCTSPSSDLATQCPGAAQGCPQRGRGPGDALTQPCTVAGLCITCKTHFIYNYFQDAFIAHISAVQILCPPLTVTFHPCFKQLSKNQFYPPFEGETHLDVDSFKTVLSGGTVFISAL